MNIAITGATGFVGSHLASHLVEGGHKVELIARGFDNRNPSAQALKGARFHQGDVTNVDSLTEAFSNCEAVAHCAGINCERGSQTYAAVHIEGTRNVIKAAKKAGIKKIVLLSFLKARPNCNSSYHESKWEAEELVLESGLDYTILKPGMIYGLGDHMLDHLSHLLHTFPVFAKVGFKEKAIRPIAIQDLVNIIDASLCQNQLNGVTRVSLVRRD